MFLQWCRYELVLSFIFVQRFSKWDRTRLRKGTTAETQTLWVMPDMTQLTETNDKKLERKAIIGGLIIIGILTLTSAYYFYIKQTSEFVFTVGLVVDVSVRPQRGQGKVIEYSIGGQTYKLECLSSYCRDTNIRDKLLLKIYRDDPRTYDIVYDVEFDQTKVPPSTGWKSIEDIR
jgi:hypothetical protein